MTRMVKSMKDFSQYDTRWADKPYKTKPYVMSTNGCGPTSCADVIVSHPNHRDVTPDTMRKWFIDHNYVVNGAGSVHAGIPAALKAFGFIPVEHKKMSVALKAFAGKKVRGILLMAGSGPDGTVWTLGGHFVAVRGYKVVNGKHYLYICDPGQRRNDGWFCYEKSMKGAVLKAWSCTVDKKKIKHSSAYYLRKKAKKIVKYMADHNFRYEASYKDNAKTWPGAKKQRTTNCSMQISYDAQEAGLIKGFFWGNGFKVTCKGGLTLKELKKKAKIFHPLKPPKKAKLKKGDICCYPKTKKHGAHTQMFEGFTKSGKPKWYSTGSKAEIKKGRAHVSSKYNDEKIYTIIRFK